MVGDHFPHRLDPARDVSGNIGATAAQFGKPIVVELGDPLHGLGAVDQPLQGDKGPRNALEYDSHRNSQHHGAHFLGLAADFKSRYLVGHFS